MTGTCLQGHFQIIFDKQHCPLLQRRLSLGMKLMYASGVWSYVVRALSMLPMIATGGRLAAGWLHVDRLMLVHTAMSWSIPVVVSTHDNGPALPIH